MRMRSNLKFISSIIKVFYSRSSSENDSGAYLILFSSVFCKKEALVLRFPVLD